MADSRFPLHAELEARGAERAGVQAAIDWINAQGYEICEDRWAGKPGHDVEYTPIRLREGRLIAAMMDIDHAAFEAEKEAIYAALSEPAHG